MDWETRFWSTGKVQAESSICFVAVDQSLGLPRRRQDRPVLAVDLQHFAVVLARAVIERTEY